MSVDQAEYDALKDASHVILKTQDRMRAILDQYEQEMKVVLGDIVDAGRKVEYVEDPLTDEIKEIVSYSQEAMLAKRYLEYHDRKNAW